MPYTSDIVLILALVLPVKVEGRHNQSNGRKEQFHFALQILKNMVQYVGLADRALMGDDGSFTDEPSA